MPLVPNNKHNETESTWVLAPMTSHVWSFRIANRTLRAKKKGRVFYRHTIEVIFAKDAGNPTRSPDTKFYQYLPDELSTMNALRLFSELALAENPGEIIDTYLKKPEVKFNKVNL